MPGTFSFSPFFTSSNFVSQTTLSAGAGIGIDIVNLFSTQGGAFNFTNNAANIVSIAAEAGQSLHFDVDFGSSNNIDTIDTELWLVDATGHVLASNNNSPADIGSTGNTDPGLNFNVTQTGMLFAVVVQKDNNYVNDTYDFNNGGTDTGVFQLNIGISGLDPLSIGTAAGETTSLALSQSRYDGRGGNDFIYAADIASSIDGGKGDDYITGSQFSDILFGNLGSDNLYGNAGDDTLVGGESSDYLIGGAGRDELFGGAGDDQVYANEGNDILWGEDGDDYIDGGDGADLVSGGEGNDTLYGSSGADKLDGGDGEDTYYVYSGSGPLTLNLNVTTAQNTGAFGMDTLTRIEDVTGTDGFGDNIRGNELRNLIYGYGGDDILFGLGGDDYVGGGAGDDEAHGGTGSDSLYGDAGDDTMYGDSGNDALNGGLGKDDLWGGTGSDNFYFNQELDSPPVAPDVIHDFSHAESDRISLYNFPGTLVFRGSGPFLNTGGEVRVVDAGSFQRVLVNLDADSDPELSIKVITGVPLVVDDFGL